MAIGEVMLTAEEFALLPDRGRPVELVRGKVVELNVPFPRHGEICVQTVYLMRQYLEVDRRGRVVSNDSAVITERNPDSVRGVDVSYFSFAKVPPGPLPQGYLAVVPDLVFEVRSSDDRWKKILAKVAEYLNAGVLAVCVLDPEPQTIHVFSSDRPARILTVDEELTLPEILGDFRVLVRRFFE